MGEDNRISRNRTRLVLLHEPDPLDYWINRCVVPDQLGFLKDTNTGRALEATDERHYHRYLQHHRARAEEGRDADELVSIGGRFNPKVEEELSTHVWRFPHKIQDLLKQAQTVRSGKGERTGGDQLNKDYQTDEMWGKPAEKASRVPAKRPQSATSNTGEEPAARLGGHRHLRTGRETKANQPKEVTCATSWEGSEAE